MYPLTKDVCVARDDIDGVRIPGVSDCVLAILPVQEVYNSLIFHNVQMRLSPHR